LYLSVDNSSSGRYPWKAKFSKYVYGNIGSRCFSGKKVNAKDSADTDSQRAAPAYCVGYYAAVYSVFMLPHGISR
jgi:hypothetical protein